MVSDFEYDLVLHDRDPDTARGPSVLAEIHPAGTAPILIDETQGPRQVIAESQAIVEWLVQVHGKGEHFTVKPCQPEYGDYLFWYSFANGTLQANMTKLGTIDLLIKNFKKMQKAKSKTANDASAAQDLNELFSLFGSRLEHQFDMLDSRLSSGRYLAGEKFTVADIMTVYSLTSMRGFYPIDLSERLYILRYLQDISQRPAHIKAMRMAEPGMEPMIEPNVKMFDFTVFKD